MNEARRHHYLPQSYLGAFTDTGDKKGTLRVLDVSDFRVFETSPLNVAVRRDFNRIDADGLPPDAVEKALSTVEGQLVDSIRSVVSRGTPPDEIERNNLMNFIALLSVRNPKNRHAFNQAQVAVAHHMADILVSDRKVFERTVRQAREASLDIPEMSFKEMRRFVRERRYEIEVGTSTNVRVEVDAIDTVLPLLSRRDWSLVLAPKEGPEFICSDHPISLLPKNGIQGPVGLGTRKTEIFVPLSPEGGMLGVFEDPMPEILMASPTLIAKLNTRTFLQAERQVYARSGSICIMTQEGIRTIDLRSPES